MRIKGSFPAIESTVWLSQEPKTFRHEYRQADERREFSSFSRISPIERSAFQLPYKPVSTLLPDHAND
jgi:hypothetical protein